MKFLLNLQARAHALFDHNMKKSERPQAPEWEKYTLPAIKNAESDGGPLTFVRRKVERSRPDGYKPLPPPRGKEFVYAATKPKPISKRLAPLAPDLQHHDGRPISEERRAAMERHEVRRKMNERRRPETLVQDPTSALSAHETALVNKALRDAARMQARLEAMAIPEVRPNGNGSDHSAGRVKPYDAQHQERLRKLVDQRNALNANVDAATRLADREIALATAVHEHQLKQAALKK